METILKLLLLVKVLSYKVAENIVDVKIAKVVKKKKNEFFTVNVQVSNSC